MPFDTVDKIFEAKIHLEKARTVCTALQNDYFDARVPDMERIRYEWETIQTFMSIATDYLFQMVPLLESTDEKLAKKERKLV